MEPINDEQASGEILPKKSDSETADKSTLPARHLDDGLNTDGRGPGKWESRYPLLARKKIRTDAIYVAAVLLGTLACLVFVWNGILYNLIGSGCQRGCAQADFTKFSLFFLGGLLGGSLFGIKYFYKVVGRGYWNEDRRLWRFFSPFVSGGLALAVGAMVDSGILGLTIKTSVPSSFLAMGFLTGYFADSALAKMQDVADTVFGSNQRDSAPSTKLQNSASPDSKSPGQ